MIKSAQIRGFSEGYLLGLSIDSQGRIWKIKYIEREEITPEIEKYTDGVIKELGWFKNVKKTSLNIREHPEEK